MCINSGTATHFRRTSAESVKGWVETRQAQRKAGGEREAGGGVEGRRRVEVRRRVEGRDDSKELTTITADQIEEEQTGKTFIYIDNSHLWIQCKKTYTEKRGLDVSQNPTCLIDVGVLKDILLGHSDLSDDEKTFDPKVRLYGSTPRIVDSLWKAFESYDIKDSSFVRSSWTRREKELDLELIVDSVDEACDLYYNQIPAVFIIVSGDIVVRSAVVKITRKGFRVHLWPWKNGLAKVFTEEDKDIDWDLFQVHYLDSLLERILIQGDGHIGHM